MKSARGKAASWLNSHGYMYSEDELRSLTLLLKEQDRDTRHACAEAVLLMYVSWKSEVSEIINKAHATIMNTRAV